MGLILGFTFGLGLALIVIGPQDPPASARSRTEPFAGLGRLARDAGVHISGLAVVALCVALFAIAFIVIAGVSRSVPVASILAVFVSYAPIAVLRSRVKKRQAEMRVLWPEIVDNLASAIRAGLSLPEALQQIGERGPPAMREPFEAFARDYQATGRFNECLDALKTRLADPVGDRIIEALRIAREVGGGDLGRMLRSLSNFLRDDLRTRGELESRQSWTVSGARIAVAAPWIVIALMSLQPEVIATFSSPTGVFILVAGAVACAVAYRLMMLLGELPGERRILQ
ncbi:MAG: type secretion system protein [Nocardioidaceae bacterium]|nr:type secretion system protein [Nocardioidaceae bacterium]